MESVFAGENKVADNMRNILTRYQCDRPPAHGKKLHGPAELWYRVVT